MITRAGTPWLVAGVLIVGCHELREPDPKAPAYADVAPILARACVPCHTATNSKVSLDGYYRLIGCTPSGAPQVLPSDERAPIYAVLARPDHAGLLDADERARLLAYVHAGAPGSPGSVHGAGILDPRSGDWHGKLAARDGFGPLRDPEAALACGRCHDGSPVRPAAVQQALAKAPACTSCHTEAQGVLACSTCHGNTGRAHPPRDRCYFPGASGDDLHASHLAALRFRADPLACTACHPSPGPSVLSGSHADGTLDLAFDPALASGAARFDPATASCQVACHARGGTLAAPSWRMRAALDCNSCHLSPPSGHYQGACDGCHREMGADATTLHPGALHIDGKVELGVPPGSCGACHGAGLDPWPEDRTHRAHRDSTLTTAVACSECHEVPAQVMAAGHLDGQLTLRFSGRALGAAEAPRYDATRKVCSDVACHGVVREAAPPWRTDVAVSLACSSCHGAPPPPPHVQRASCEGALCHGREVVGIAPSLRVTAQGRALHVDGTLSVGR